MSGRRNLILAIGETYHTFNRTIANEEAFTKNKETRRAFELINYYRFPQTIKYSRLKTLPMEMKQNYLSGLKKLLPLVEIYAFALMPDHFHFLLKQTREKGISTFLSTFENSFAKYFNKKNNRNGGLFQRPFKARRVTNDEQLIHVSRYIHLNPVTSYIVDLDGLSKYPWSSFSFYSDKKNGDLVNTSFILKIIGSKEKYESFVANQADYQRKLHLIKNLIL